MKIRLTKKDIIIFFLALTILCIFLYIFNPGILTYDSYFQLQQIATREFTNWHPFLHTFIEMLLLKICNTPAIIAFFQILVFSTIWTFICKYNRTKSTKNFIFQIILTIIITLNPINFLYSITLWKDILFSYLLLLVCFLLQIIVDKKFKCSFLFAIFFSFSLALLAQIRYNGSYIVYIILACLIFLFFKKDRKGKMYIKIPLMTIVMIFSISLLNVVYNVVDNEKDAISPKLMQYLSYYLTEDKISKTDQEEIAKVASLKELKQRYEATYTDGTYIVINMEKYQEEKGKLFKLALKYSFKYPNMALTFAFDSTAFIWNPIFPKKDYGTILVTSIESINNEDKITPGNANKSFYQQTKKVIDDSLKNDWIKTIFYSPAFYFYLSIVIMLILFVKFKYRTLFIVLPNLLNILIVALSNPIHDVRYIYPNIIIFYLLCVILFKKMEEKHERKTIKYNKK